MLFKWQNIGATIQQVTPFFWAVGAKHINKISVCFLPPGLIPFVFVVEVCAFCAIRQFRSSILDFSLILRNTFQYFTLFHIISHYVVIFYNISQYVCNVYEYSGIFRKISVHDFAWFRIILHDFALISHDFALLAWFPIIS